ncbi:MULTISPECIES: STAS domain-containing protein [Streptomyces]|uniref:Anti-sigma factor antagonist n=2 Tax=Streptomyces TaxID=1883 RepID=A0A100YA00_9ACTN|nr:MULTISPECIES: STAS domain-containing protein [Streptomyces]KUH40381.1 anti-anti-sigma factor [Streptomyces kanasensis]UUS29831.1 STAS domain-containing protein [Streptomyces changanensis]
MTQPVLTVDQQIHRDGPVVLRVVGELDHHTAPRLTEALDGVPSSATRGLVIDLSGLTYCDSTGITVLVTTYHRAGAVGCPLVLSGLGDDLTRVFHTIGLDQVFTLRPTTDAAVAALRA